MRNDGKIHGAYKALEERMRKVAEADNDVFLPNPQADVPYIMS
jgi:hypothetical protein